MEVPLFVANTGREGEHWDYEENDNDIYPGIWAYDLGDEIKLMEGLTELNGGGKKWGIYYMGYEGLDHGVEDTYDAPTFVINKGTKGKDWDNCVAETGGTSQRGSTVSTKTAYQVLLAEYQELCSTCTENKLHNSIRFSPLVSSDVARAYHVGINVDKTNPETIVNSVYFGFVNQGQPMKEQARRVARALLWGGNQMEGLLNLDLSNDGALKTQLQNLNFQGGVDSLNKDSVLEKFSGKDENFFTDGSSGGQASGDMPDPKKAGKGAAGSQAGAAKMGLGCANSASSFKTPKSQGYGKETGQKSSGDANPWVQPESDGSFNKAQKASGDCNTLGAAINWDAMNKDGQAGSYTETPPKLPKGSKVTGSIERYGEVSDDAGNKYEITIKTYEIEHPTKSNTYVHKMEIKDLGTGKTEHVKAETGSKSPPDSVEIDSPKKGDQGKVKVDTTGAEKDELSGEGSMESGKADPTSEGGDGKSAYQKFSESCGGPTAQSCMMQGIASISKEKAGKKGQCDALGMVGMPAPGSEGGFGAASCKDTISAAGVSLLPGAAGSGIVGTQLGKVVVYVDPKTTTPSDFQVGGAFATSSISSGASAQAAEQSAGAASSQS